MTTKWISKPHIKSPIEGLKCKKCEALGITSYVYAGSIEELFNRTVKNFDCSNNHSWRETAWETGEVKIEDMHCFRK